MDTGDLVRDAFEVLVVIAIGGMLWSVLTRLRRGQLVVPACPECGGPSSRAYPELSALRRPAARRALMAADLPFPHYYALLDRLQEHLRPRGYVEIGVANGHSLGLTRPGTVAVGVDPAPGPEVDERAPGRRVVATTSQAFFADHDRADVLGDTPLDLAFVDGLHLFEAALADVAALEAWAHPDTVVLLHDCHPTDAAMAARERETVAWAGDVWKVVACLRSDRPDLSVTTVDVGPTGVGVITGLGAGFADLEGSIERHRDLDYRVLADDPQGLLHLVPPTWDAVLPLLP